MSIIKMRLTLVSHVVQAGETITSIAEMYGIQVERLIRGNGLQNPNELVIGQCIVIVYPELTYTIQKGDTLESIARSNNISVIQLLRNNPFLSDREFLYPGETLVISYGEKKDSITTNGYANPFIDREILKKTLPFLTYLSIFGYRVTENADIIEPGDDDLIQLARYTTWHLLWYYQHYHFKGLAVQKRPTTFYITKTL
jgi:spore germination protein